MIHFDFNKQCTGCKSCADVCNKGCISFKENEEGFFMPVVDTSLCIECHRCEQVCPSLSSKSSATEHHCFAYYHRDEEIRHIGSSGSAFFALAEWTLRQGGSVYAAAMNDDLQLRHTRASTLDEVKQQMKSKYIQSDTSGVYRQVLDDLRSDRQVLFVGTPCQCKALDNLVPMRLRSRLLIADFICHGVPSQRLFNEGIAEYERQHRCKVTAFSFREKSENNLRNYGITYNAKDGTMHTKIGELDEIPYCYGFFNHFTKRNSCYACRQRGVERSSDLTLGDFWGLEQLQPHLDDFNKGYSSVITNTEIGTKILSQLSNCYIEEVADGVAFVVKRNNAYTRHDNKSLLRSLFFLTRSHLGYSFAERHFLQQRPPLPDRLLKSLIIRIDKLINTK